MTDRSSVPSRILGARETLLGDENALENVNTTTLNDGAFCYVIGAHLHYELHKDDTRPPNPPYIIQPIAGPGRWVPATGGTQGAQGAQGAQGGNGAQGAQGATGSGSQGAQGATGTQGFQGAQGTQGSGSQGAQGATGAQGPGGGAQGAQGAQGGNGAQGAQGATGSGSQGAQGATGTAGAQGAQGASGAAGAQGAQGASGAAGAQGSQGAQGRQGASGTAGTAGAQGAQGAQGATGTAGAQGFQGATGSGAQGAQGASGAAGAQGAQGAPGSGAQGAQGASGTAGAQGAQGAPGSGAQGAQGAAGTAGAQGSQGAQGRQGATGAQGATGSGAQGAQGATGTAGAQGAQGAPGSGAQGAQGATGTAGAQGAQGAAGSGAQGAQGATGTAGAQGFQGATGSGAQGAQGATGTQGFQGAQGKTGNTGAQGATGNTGSQGAQGATGSGAQGAQGATGSSGAQGSQGAQGRQGSTGAQGAQGFQGASSALPLSNTYWVDKNTTATTHDGSIGKPFASITTAVAAATTAGIQQLTLIVTSADYTAEAAVTLNGFTLVSVLGLGGVDAGAPRVLLPAFSVTSAMDLYGEAVSFVGTITDTGAGLNITIVNGTWSLVTGNFNPGGNTNLYASGIIGSNGIVGRGGGYTDLQNVVLEGIWIQNVTLHQNAVFVTMTGCNIQVASMLVDTLTLVDTNISANVTAGGTLNTFSGQGCSFTNGAITLGAFTTISMDAVTQASFFAASGTTGATKITTLEIPALFDYGTVGVNTTINLNTHGKLQKVTISANVTLTVVTGPIGFSTLQIKQGAGGSHVPTLNTVTWMGGAAPTWSTVAGHTDIVTLFFDGTTIWASAQLNFF